MKIFLDHTAVFLASLLRLHQPPENLSRMEYQFHRVLLAALALECKNAVPFNPLRRIPCPCRHLVVAVRAADWQSLRKPLQASFKLPLDFFQRALAAHFFSGTT